MVHVHVCVSLFVVVCAYRDTSLVSAITICSDLIEMGGRASRGPCDSVFGLLKELECAVELTNVSKQVVLIGCIMYFHDKWRGMERNEIER